MKKLLLLFFFAGLASVVHAQANSANPDVAASVLYQVTSVTSPGLPSSYPAHMAGVLTRAFWNAIVPTQPASAQDPTDPAYNWTSPLVSGSSSFDGLLTGLPANIVEAISIQMGPKTPNWLLDELESDTGPSAGLTTGTHGTFVTVWNNNYNGESQNTTLYGSRPLAVCGLYEFPIPWDTTYQTALHDFLIALKTHLAGVSNNAALVRMYVNPITDQTGEEISMMPNKSTGGTLTCDTSTPYTDNCICPYSGSNTSGCPGSPPTGGTPAPTCTPNMFDDTGDHSDTGQWIADGYTPTRAETAWKTILSYYAADFPTIVLSSTFPGATFPPINNNGTNTGQVADAAEDYVFQWDECQSLPHPAVQTNTAQPTSISSGWLNQSSTAPAWCVHGSQEKTGQSGLNYDQEANAVVSNSIAWIEMYGANTANPPWGPIQKWVQAQQAHPVYTGYVAH
jgi:hypothetical protein